MSQIAEKAGTTVGAVSVTLNGAKSKTVRVGTNTRLRIEQAAEELGYRRNPFASALATGRSRILGVMLPYAASFTVHDAFFSLLITGITACAAEHGFNVMLYSAAAEAEGERAAGLIDRLVAGVVLVSPPVGSPIPAECDRQAIPFVAILGGSGNSRLTVDSDDYRGAQLAMRHLLDLGHRRIAHLEGLPEVSTSYPRKRAYLECLREAGLPQENTLCLPGNFNRADAHRSTRRWLSLPADQRPTAIFACNDLSAHGALDAAYDVGLRVPEDIAVIGFDDTWYATVTRPPLTSVQVDVPALGRQAGNMLLRHIEHPSGIQEHLVLPVSLSIRESCGASTSRLANSSIINSSNLESI